ncbi:MAG: hypothetical protein MK135_10925, partial [Polyangiaceae bacterium]|nr:hypothetical protein [Polyangiaceae bacterium]
MPSSPENHSEILEKNKSWEHYHGRSSQLWMDNGYFSNETTVQGLQDLNQKEKVPQPLSPVTARPLILRRPTEFSAAQDGVDSVKDQKNAMSKNTLSITDNRTGKTYESEITDDTIRSMDLRQIKVGEDDFGMLGYDPAFTNTASCRSAVTFIDGGKGILRYRGYPVDQLAEKTSWLECAKLVLDGELPSKDELAQFESEVAADAALPEGFENLISAFPRDAHPMGRLISMFGALGTYNTESKIVHDAATRKKHITRLIAQVTTIAAYNYRHSKGLPF